MKRNQPVEWTENQEACIEALAVFARGRHHCHNLKPHGNGVRMTWMRGEISTYDGDDLTRLVLTGHAFAVRMSVEPCGPKLLRITAFKRRHPDGSAMKLWERHPSLAELRDLIDRWVAELAEDFPSNCGLLGDSNKSPRIAPGA